MSATPCSNTTTCAVCGSDRQNVILEAQYENEKDLDLIDKFRASGDELLIDRLVACADCGMQVHQPAPAWRLDLFELRRGRRPGLRVADAGARAHVCDRAWPHRARVWRAAWPSPRRRDGGGRLPRGGDRARLAGGRLRAQPLARGMGVPSVRRPHQLGQCFRPAVRACEFRRHYALGRHRAHDRSASHARSLPDAARSPAASWSSTTPTSAAGSRAPSAGGGCS